MTNLNRELTVFAIAAALGVFAFSGQAQAAPPCNHSGYTTQQKCASNALCTWCRPGRSYWYQCWWKARPCGK